MRKEGFKNLTLTEHIDDKRDKEKNSVAYLKSCKIGTCA